MKWALAILCWTVAATAVFCENRVPPPPASLDPASVEDYISHYARARGIVGLSVAIARGGSVVWSGAFGQSSLETGALATTDTVFSIGSVTKQFTAACILLLAQDGKLSVHDKVARYYPNLTRAEDITLLDLMNHVSGYPDYYPLDFVDSRMESPISPDDLIERYAGGKLDFEPGTKWSYSNTGFVILGRIVEKVSGKKLGEFMTERILRPAGMGHSFFGPPAGRDMAEGCTRFALGPQKRARPEAQGWLDGAAGLNCTALDLVKWDMALTGGRVLNAESYALMTEPRRLPDGREREYGCGIGVQNIAHTIVLNHEGAVSGFQTWNVTVPAARSALVILSDCEEWDAVNELKVVLAKLIMPDAPWIPVIAGPDAGRAALNFYDSLRKGSIDRTELGDEFSRYLTADKIREASARFKTLGPARGAEIKDRSERGGMEVADVRLATHDGAISALIYRTPDGKIQECLFQPAH
ncbi:MAG TPA: serine hydrolase domain-containing protein [Verrucomicrobiae bacterium]|jgi:CubicO group peptidase (beta-lactamase class C family)